MPHEFDYIAWVRSRTSGHARLKVGLGDDAAVWSFPQPADCLVTVDMLMEGTDFTFPPATPRQAGRKSLGVNLSDIAAMAGLPTAAVVSVALPRRGGFDLGRELFEGIASLAAEFEVALIGGDTNTWDGPLVISITVLGETTGRGAVRRNGALPGDWIMATGSFGGSIQGKHFDFTPRVREAQALHRAVELHAMIDVSDGLAADLGHILEESRVGAVLDAAAVPVSAAAAQAMDGKSPLDHALGDGEDFELLFTVAPEEGRRLLLQSPCETPLAHIGDITRERDYVLKSAEGSLTPLAALGWKHGFEGPT